MVKSARNPAIRWTVCLAMVCGSSACERHTTVDVSLHGVNYSDRVFSYSVKDPLAKDKSGAGGELIDPFGAGGTMCCVTLPMTWRPGLKLQVDTTYWLDKRPDGVLPEIKETRLVDVPPYVNGKPGELWVLRAVDGSVSVVSSDFQPDHPKWPGKTKGWPVPSLEYRRERWKILYDHEQGGVENALSLLEELKKEPKSRAKEAWEFAREHDRKSIEGFSGPDDPKYVVFLKRDYEAYLEYSRGRVRQLMEEKP